MRSNWNGIGEQHRHHQHGNQTSGRHTGWRIVVYITLITLLLSIAQSQSIAAHTAFRTDVAWNASPIASGPTVNANAQSQPTPDWQPQSAYTGPPLIMIWPTIGPPDTLIEVSGYGFAPREQVTISAGRDGVAENELLTTLRTSGQGTIRDVVMLPERAMPGEQWHLAISPVGSIFKAVSNGITVVAPQSESDTISVVVITPIVVMTPIEVPTEVPTAIPTVTPTVTPTVIPTATPTAIPTVIPTATPTTIPTVIPTEIPTTVPTVTLTTIPTTIPTVTPTEIMTAVPTVAPTVQPAANWMVTFYNNPTLSAPPVTIAQVSEVNFDWGTNAPVPQLSPDNFSARFERTVELPAGFYTMSAQADDGVRVFVNDELVIDEWHLGAPPVYRTGRQLSGPTIFRVEYYEAGGGANLRFTYELVNEFPDWQATFYNNLDLSGEPIWMRAEGTGVDGQLSHQWSLESPVEGIPPDNWSGRWTGTFGFEGGDYEFRAEANDGVRVWLDDLLIIDEWTDEESQAEVVFQNVTPGEHTVTVEYYERGGIANLKVWWDRFIP